MQALWKDAKNRSEMICIIGYFPTPINLWSFSSWMSVFTADFSTIQALLFAKHLHRFRCWFEWLEVQFQKHSWTTSSLHLRAQKKDFVHSGSIGLIQGKHSGYCYNILDLRISLQWFKVNLSPLSEVNLECIYNGSFVLALAKSIYYPFVNA